MLRSPGTSSAAASARHPGYVSGRWYPITDGATSNAAVAAINTIYLVPFQIQSPITFTSMLMRVITGGAGSSAKSAIWANSAVSMRPLNVPLLADNAGVATTSSSVNVTLALAGTLNPGFYWFGSKFTGTLPSVQCVGASGVAPVHHWGWMGVAAAAATFPTLCFGLSSADTYSNDIAATSFSEGASFTVVTSAVVPNAAFVT
jgi:hypothetical protein